MSPNICASTCFSFGQIVPVLRRQSVYSIAQRAKCELANQEKTRHFTSSIIGILECANFKSESGLEDFKIFFKFVSTFGKYFRRFVA